MEPENTERFVDEETNPIPPKDSWGTLSVNQQIDLRNRLYDRYFAFRNVPTIRVAIEQSIATLDRLISSTEQI